MYLKNVTIRFTMSEFVGAFGKTFSALTPDHALATLSQVRRRAEVALNRPELADVAELCVEELDRSVLCLTAPQVVDTVDSIAKLRVQFNRADFLVNVDPLLIRLRKFLRELSGRRLAVAHFAVAKLGHPCAVDFTSDINILYETAPERVLTLASRDKVLLICAAVNSLSVPLVSMSLSDAARTTNKLVERLVGELKRLSKFDDISMLISSLGKLRRINRALKLELGFIDSCVAKTVREMHAAVRDSPRSISNKSLLSVIWGLGQVGFGSQPVLVDLYRLVYSREWSGNETAFLFFLYQTKSGVKDDSILHWFLHRVEPSFLNNANLVNALVGLTTLSASRDIGNGLVVWDVTEKCLDVAYRRTRYFKADQLLEVISAAASLEVRDSGPVSALVTEAESRLEKFSFSQVVIFFSRFEIFSSKLGNPAALKDRLNLALIARFKQKQTLTAADLMLLGRAIRSLKAKPNLKERFCRVLMIAIKDRLIPTPVLLTELKLVSDLGVFRMLPIQMQEVLYSKANEGQKLGVKPPLDPLLSLPLEYRRRVIDTSKRLVKIVDSDDEEEQVAEAERESRVEEEKIELEGVESGETPARKFIKAIRAHRI